MVSRIFDLRWASRPAMAASPIAPGFAISWDLYVPPFPTAPRDANYACQICHSGLLTPYFGWKVSHHHHHMNHGSMEREETWIPLTRSEMKLPAEDEKFDYEEYFGDAPIWTLGMLVLRQVIAFPVYLRKPTDYLASSFPSLGLSV